MGKTGRKRRARQQEGREPRQAPQRLSPARRTREPVGRDRPRSLGLRGPSPCWSLEASSRRACRVTADLAS